MHPIEFYLFRADPIRRARRGSRNPIAFTPYPVTIISFLVYLAVLIPLLVIHLVVPPAPGTETPVNGVNISEASVDLQFLSNGFHPYNSKRNDAVKDWLLQRIDDILVETNTSRAYVSKPAFAEASGESPSVVVFNDMTSNLTFSGAATGSPVTSTYFEGTNIIVYVRGSRDPDGDWWLSGEKPDLGGVLVNAHYDSVSTGYGATDDGVGVVTLLQLLRFFSTNGNSPQRGVVLLFNNGEEDWLNGARAFARHPISRFPHSFLNLEGAGAGGRATLFRSTDAEVTSFYRGTQHPFGSAISGDGFKRGFIRSGTDYSVFYDSLGMRGLDVAFMEPRARYHTEQDDFRHTSRDSIWHMLSAAVHTASGLAANTDRTFEGDASGRGKVPSGTGSDAVWFDLFGRSFVVFELHTLFAISVTLLVVAPIALIITGIVLSKTDKLYLFSMSAKLHHADGHEKVQLRGFRGFFRFPILLVVASVILFGLAFLMAKVNPYIIYSSPYSTWSMMLSAWIFVAWFLSRMANFARPTAFQRSFALVWLFVLGWVALVIATVYEEKLKIASGYYIVVNFALISLATLIAFLEQFALETRCGFAESLHTESDADSRHRQSSVPRSTTSGERAASQERPVHGEDDEDEPTESTSLLVPRRATFANYTSNSRTHTGEIDGDESVHDEDPRAAKVYEYEQLWSHSLPTWTWLLQFLLLAVIPIIIAGQIGLLLTSAAHQTAADGSSVLTGYFIVALFSIFLLVPLGPFIHRLTYHIPLFLLAVCVGTIIYNLVAFPFSDNSRLKLYFVQRVDLDTGFNEVAINGMDGLYIDKVIASLPSAAGQPISVSGSRRTDLIEHTFPGLPPLVVPNTPAGVPPALGYADWLHVNATRTGPNEARIALVGRRTRSCRLFFASPIADFRVDGSDADARFPGVPDEGVAQIRLWSRDWERGWTVTVRWDGDDVGLDGKAVCLWNDEGYGAIPALEEFRRFAPDWAAVTKLDDGLVEGSKTFLV